MRRAVVISLVAAACGHSSTYDGTIALCAPEDPRSTAVLAIHAHDNNARSSQTQARVLVPLDAITGKAGPTIDAGRTASCLGGVGPNVLVTTAAHGTHLRDPRTGAITTTEAQLLGTAGHVRETRYDARTHRLWLRTEFGDEVIVDVATLARWPARDAPPPPAIPAEAEGVAPPASHAVAQLVSFGMTNAFFAGGDAAYSRYEAAGRYGLACDGSKCRLATRELDAYGNGSSLTPITTADVLLVAHGIGVVAGRGALVSRLARLDEASRELVFVGLDGKVQWTRPDLKDTTYYPSRQLDDHVLLQFQHFEQNPPNYAPKTDLYLIDARGRDVWKHTFGRNTNWWDQELTTAVVRFGDAVLLGVNAEVVAMPIGPGKARWHYDP